MVEIKRTRSGQSFLNKPVGVTKVTTGAERVYAQQAEILSGVGEFAFELAKEDQVTRGKEYANTARVRDENGNLTYKPLPFDLGRYGQAAANNILSNRYMIALKDDMATAAAEISKISDGDPTKWEEGFSAWTKQRAKLIEGTGGTDIIAPFIDSAYTYQKEFVNDLVIKRVEAEKKATNATYGLNTRSLSNDIRNTLAAGEYEDASSIFNAAILENNYLYKDGTISLESHSKAQKEILRARFDGLVDSRFAETDPKFKKALAIELRGGSTAFNVLEKNPDIKEAFDSLPDSDQATVSNALTKSADQQTAFFEKNKTAVEAFRRAGTGIASSEDMTFVMNNKTYETASGNIEPIGTGLAILESPERRSAATQEMKSAGHLEPEFADSVRALLNGRNYDLDVPGLNDQILGAVTDALESDQFVGGKAIFRTDMGLNRSDIIKIDFLRDAQRDGPTAFENALNVLVTGEARFDVIKEGLGESFKGKTLTELAGSVSEKLNIPANIKPDMMNTIIDALVLHNGNFSEVSKSVNKVIEKIYTDSSDYVEGMTAYAPEIRIPELAITKDHRYNFFTYALESFKGDRNVKAQPFAEERGLGQRNLLNEAIEKKLSLSTQKNLTQKDVTLVPDLTRSDNKRTVYFIKEKKTGLTVTNHNGQNAVIDTDEFSNLIKIEAARDEEYRTRYTGGTDELEVFLQGFYGLIGTPASLMQGFLNQTVGRLGAKGFEFETPALGTRARYRGIISDLFNNPDNPYYD